MPVAMRDKQGMDDDDRQAIALWRISVLGALISARLEHGDRTALFSEAASRVHQLPDGRFIKVSARTIETWFHQHRHGGFTALLPKSRSDRDQSRAIRPEVADLVLRARREKPRRSINRIIRLLERAGAVRKGELSRSSVHRLLEVHHISGRPLRGPSAERRSFQHEHAGDLWVGDALHGPLVIAPDGHVRKSYMLSLIDGATRFVPHSYFAVSEDAAAHEHGFKQALLKYGRPRTYYVDLGAAYVATSLRVVCAELAIHLKHTQPRDCEAKGVIERFNRTWREEVGDELPETPLPLDELNARHWAWLSVEYHARVHDTTKRSPREHWLSEVDQLRPLPQGANLDEIFLHRDQRTVRKDGTVRFGGELLEVRAELTGQRVELRFDPNNPAARPRVFVQGRFYCDTVPLDRHANTVRIRRRGLGAPAPDSAPTGLDPLGLMQAAHTRSARPIDARDLDDDDSDPEE